jgi:hypothetical protein
LYEGLEEKGALMLVPSSAVESMGMGGLLGRRALAQQTLTGSDEVRNKLTKIEIRGCLFFSGSIRIFIR